MATKKRKLTDFDFVGQDLAKIMDVKRRFIEAGVQRGDRHP